MLAQKGADVRFNSAAILDGTKIADITSRYSNITPRLRQYLFVARAT